ncbi:DNA polymerase III subunit gamma/tau [Enterococcus malodoratus]|uniref:DNA-directed DNA polymerase n=1 Tax=Enterococcus malodoratus ATCC 43197 TaxID=1158601 RepID=R2RMT5_9ENTE|nr:DNA polymerase III subunit gamma/tau [Enterococcus malodoratus]EOH77324.1 DNA polymerase III, subunit gamma and tau [Enterococcus malodoratus ATCC 43197]EOT64262.1 DNA polymerase III, subunit gamma and tau [Enterococcus malodoratus ATCC 43197]SPX00672.1 DNA polymerase III subunits gamma and tau [Enterococcus malodoratus]STD66318.1 DNA polymerase III subunits gamma and tau [Enterococcus malodoratus]
MAYQALYRVWRSQRFDDLVGQEAITKTLKNAIQQQKTSHAYLFTGPRGTGKTSAAKIFAKAINCPNSVDGEPCNECEMCRSITEGRQEDVIEIDAASNNGVEEIRFIRDRANYAPTTAEYKVYIIDEVHMLSTGAFNALLKTLEEPKEHVIFVLATTEPHKIPATIISRTQRFDFKRIDVQAIIGRMAYILEQSNQPYEEQALSVIARAAEGGMRDALSILDQAISFSNEKITLEDALAVTGSLTTEMMDNFIGACLQQNVSGALEVLENILAEGKEARRLTEDLLLYCRDLLIYQQAPKLLENRAAYLTENFKQLAETTASERLYSMIKILSETQNEIRFTNHANIYLEVATVKLATPQTTTESSTVVQSSNMETPAAIQPAEQSELLALKTQLQQLQNEMQQIKNNPTSEKEERKVAPKKTASSYRVPTERVYQVLSEATKDHLLNVKNVWEDLLMALSVTQRAMLKASEPMAAGPGLLLIAFDYEIVCQRADSSDELRLNMQNSLSMMIKDYSPDFVFITRESWPRLRQAFVSQHQDRPVAVETNDTEDEISLLPPEETNEVVEQAKSLFGDLVTIKED